MSNEIQVLAETFFIANESCVFTFDGQILQWRGNSVHVSNFVVVDYVHIGNCCSGKKSKTLSFRKAVHACKGHDTMVIHYGQCQKKNKMRLNSVRIQGESQILGVWLRALRSALDNWSAQRPRNYLVFINPFSGRQNGLELYMKKVKPIFELAKIETCEVVTKSRGDFEKVICSGVECYDGILAVGGDGTVSEIVNCLISSQMDMVQTEEGDMPVPKIQTPIAIIPCGSTDCVAFTLNGTRDIESSALYAILGNRSCFDVCRAISENGLNRFFVSVFTYGYLSDLIRESEKFRWMGPIRYNYAGLLTLLRSKEYYGQLDLTGEQCSRKHSSLALIPQKPVGKKSKSVSLYDIPILPIVEPTEYLETRYKCAEKSKSKCEIKKEKELERPSPSPSKTEAEDPKSENPSVEQEEEVKSEEPPKDDYKGTENEDPPKCEDWEPPKCEEEKPPRFGGDEPAQCEGEELPKCEDEERLDKSPNCEGDIPQSESLVEKPKQEISQEVIPLSMSAGQNQKSLQQFNIKGRYFLIACANISCSSELTPNGIAPNCIPGDGNMNVVLFQPNSICDLYKIYTRLTSKDRAFLLSDLPFVTIYKTKQVRINVTQKDADKINAANCDGELFHDSVVDIRLYEGIVQFLTRG